MQSFEHFTYIEFSNATSEKLWPNSLLKWHFKVDIDLFLYIFQGTLRNGNYSPYSNGHSPNNNGHNTINSSGLSESLGDISLVHSPPVTPEVRH